MARKRPSKPKKPKRPKATDGTNLANVVLFLQASVADSQFRDDISGGNEQTVRDALYAIGIDLPAPHFNALVNTCLALTDLPGAWDLFDGLRLHLLGSGGPAT